MDGLDRRIRVVWQELLSSGGRCYSAWSLCSKILLLLVASTVNIDRFAALARRFALVTFDSPATAAQTACATPFALRERARNYLECQVQPSLCMQVV